MFKPGVAQKIKDQAIRSGQPIPDRILNAPQLSECLEFFVTAFWELSTCRQLGMGEGPIPVTAIMEYGRFYDCNQEFTQDLIFYVSVLDAIYLKHQNRKTESKK